LSRDPTIEHRHRHDTCKLQQGKGKNKKVKLKHKDETSRYKKTTENSKTVDKKISTKIWNKGKE